MRINPILLFKRSEFVGILKRFFKSERERRKEGWREKGRIEGTEKRRKKLSQNRYKVQK